MSLRRGSPVRWIALAVAVSAVGMAAHTVVEFGYPALLAPGSGMIPMVGLQVLLFILWLLSPALRPAMTIALVASAILQLVGGAIISVLPLPFLPFAPEQTWRHYLVHVFLGITQIPLVLIPLAVRKRGRELSRVKVASQ